MAIDLARQLFKIIRTPRKPAELIYSSPSRWTIIFWGPWSITSWQAVINESADVASSLPSILMMMALSWVVVEIFTLFLSC